MEMGRVYMPMRSRSPGLSWQTPNKLCHDSHSLYCYYEKWTNCTMAHVNNLASTQAKVRMFKMDQEAIDYFRNSGRISQKAMNNYISERVINFYPPIHFDYLRFLVPKPLSVVTDSIVIKPTRIYYWWRAISASYLIRLNKQTQYLIQQFSIPGLKELNGKCVSMYIRYGDKAREMKLRPVQSYLEIAVKLWEAMYSTNSSNKVLVVGTETPSVLMEVLNWARDNGDWRILYNPIQLEIFKEKGNELFIQGIANTLPSFKLLKLKRIREFIDIPEKKESNVTYSKAVDNNSTVGRVVKNNSLRKVESKYIQHNPRRSIHNNNLARQQTQHNKNRINHDRKNIDDILKSPRVLIQDEDSQSDSDILDREMQANESFDDVYPFSNFHRKLVTQLFLNQEEYFEKFIELEYISIITNLADIMRCDSFVCTLGSNYCRLVDELRAMIAAKPENLFADLSFETCRNPPCVGPQGFASFDW